MLKYLTIVLLSVFPATTALADWQLFPALYDVTGVASDDVLNVRKGPGASYPVIEALAPYDRYIEIIRLSDDGRWGLIGYAEGSGWTSMRYLARQRNLNGPDLPRPLNCGGNEPFWGLSFSANGSDFNEPGEPPRFLSSTWEGIPEGMLPIAYGVRMAQGSGEISAIITRSQCSDGMSDKEYGFAINALLSGAFGNRMLTGCCSLERPRY
ncbi:MAG: SH3 domain-containing protein, partial [Marinosulfonomonas sp.]|nr:SH3 domain-containing protein [Marinosulfonomonas sp.]